MVASHCFLFLMMAMVSLYGWLLLYIDFEDFMICYGCKEINPYYDYIIVGAGTSGCVVARRLAENSSFTILLIEAGGKGNDLISIPITAVMLQKSNFDWQYTTTKQKGACKGFRDGKCVIPQGKMLGGTHSMNYMLYTRGHRSDYDSWFKDLPGYSYEKDVEEYFNRAEDVYSTERESLSKTFAPAFLTPLSYFSPISDVVLKTFIGLGYLTTNSTHKFFGG